MITKPDYTRIYRDLVELKHPCKLERLKQFLKKEALSFFDIINIEKIINEDQFQSVFNQQHRSYSREDIKELLNYQKQNKLTDKDLGLQFKISRNTIHSWKKQIIK